VEDSIPIARAGTDTSTHSQSGQRRGLFAHHRSMHQSLSYTHVHLAARRL